MTEDPGLDRGVASLVLANATFVSFSDAWRAADQARWDLDTALTNKTEHDIHKLESNITMTTAHAERAFYQIDVPMYFIIAHCHLIVCTPFKFIADQFMNSANARICCAKTRIRFGVTCQAAHAKDVMLIKPKHILEVLDMGAQSDAMFAFIDAVISVVICDCRRPYRL